MSAETIGRLDEIHLAVEDLPKMRRFYTEVLGFDEEFYHEGWGLGLSTGGASLVLRDSTRQSSGVDLSLTCKDIERLLEALTEKGITITEPLYEGHWGAKVAGFEDPEGNTIYLEEPVEAKGHHD